MLVDLLCSQGPPLKHGLALRISVEAGPVVGPYCNVGDHSGAASRVRKLLRCCHHQYLLGCRVHDWLGFQRLHSCMLLTQVAARSAASVCDQWLNRPQVQSTLSAAVSCIPTFWCHAASHFVTISILKLRGPRSMFKTANCCWRVLNLAAVRSVSASEQQNIKSFSMIEALLLSSGITLHVLQHGAMSYWQHSFTGQASRSMQHPTLHSLSAPQITNLSPEQQAVVA